MFKNILVSYKGGGYDGCFWERNFFFFDQKGTFHNILSTGRAGIKNESEAIEMLNANEYDSLYNMDSSDDMAKFFKYESINNCLSIPYRVNAIQPITMYMECMECGESFYPDENNPIMYDKNCYRGNGGVGIEITSDLWCFDCYCSKACGYCGSVCDDDDKIYDEKTDSDYCKWCEHEHKKET
jgi:hypothetical protein